MCVDADFVAMWHREYSKLRECALSRTGFIITYCGCPIHWVSKLQLEIALSTTESEFIALSMASRELLPCHYDILLRSYKSKAFSRHHLILLFLLLRHRHSRPLPFTKTMHHASSLLTVKGLRYKLNTYLWSGIISKTTSRMEIWK